MKVVLDNGLLVAQAAHGCYITQTKDKPVNRTFAKQIGYTNSAKITQWKEVNKTQMRKML